VQQVLSFTVWIHCLISVSVLSTEVQFRSNVGREGAPSSVEFAVSGDIGDSETSFLVYAMDFSYCCDSRFFDPIVEGGSGDELDVSRYGYEKRNFIHEHNVHTKGIVAGFLRYVHRIAKYPSQFTVGWLALDLQVLDRISGSLMK
jgi:hypothetical protein